MCCERLGSLRRGARRALVVYTLRHYFLKTTFLGLRVRDFFSKTAEENI
jgi:hypothetical protein